MSVNLQQAIEEQTRVLSEDEMRRVLDFMTKLRQKESLQTKTISAIFAELSGEASLEEWKELPPDGAENHDYYLYGAPKKTENIEEN
jgi:antirestriction protein